MKVALNKQSGYRELIFIDKKNKERLAIGYIYAPNNYEIGFNISFYTHFWIGFSLLLITFFIHFNSKYDKGDNYENL